MLGSGPGPLAIKKKQKSKIKKNRKHVVIFKGEVPRSHKLTKDSQTTDWISLQQVLIQLRNYVNETIRVGFFFRVT